MDADGYLGCPYQGLESLKITNAKLASKVWQQVNDSQELVLINDFARENNEFQFRKSVQDRISDINSWRWVLEDLSKRLDEAMATLKYEHKAIRVVVDRVKSEIRDHSREATRPGAMGPMTDSVEEAIKEEHDFLRDQKRNFEKMIVDLEKKVNALEKTKKRIQQDVLKKHETISLEESCASIDLNNLGRVGSKLNKKQKLAHLTHWENRCASLKKDGLRALNDAFILRQQLRGARVQLSIAAQQYATKVDGAIRKRLHANNTKLHELDWQKQEALRDLATLDEELSNTEQSLLTNMEQERVMEARLADRAKRPRGELIKDNVDRKLRDELARLRLFIKNLRDNRSRINDLKKDLTDSISKIDCCVEDLMTVLRLDSERIQSRIGEQSAASNYPTVSPTPSTSAPTYRDHTELKTIKEEDEDDYPYDD